MPQNIPVILPKTSSVSSAALEALHTDYLLPICKACGTQYPRPQETCVICEDPRQAVPPSGQQWTDLAEMSGRTKNVVEKDWEDGRISFINTEPGFGIHQTPILIETDQGSYIWDCAALITLSLVSYLKGLTRPLKGIAVSHPHFFTTSLTWSRALRIPLYLCSADKQWFQRLEDIRENDQVIWWDYELKMGEGVTLIQCGGHFPGSCILHWDRSVEPHSTTPALPRTGIIFTADTIMVQPTQKGFSFIWSVPNMIPLRPRDTLRMAHKMEFLSFDKATSSWPNRFIRSDAKEVFRDSVRVHLGACGWGLEGDRLVAI